MVSPRRGRGSRRRRSRSVRGPPRSRGLVDEALVAQIAGAGCSRPINPISRAAAHGGAARMSGPRVDATSPALPRLGAVFATPGSSSGLCRARLAQVHLARRLAGRDFSSAPAGWDRSGARRRRPGLVVGVRSAGFFGVAVDAESRLVGRTGRWIGARFDAAGMPSGEPSRRRPVAGRRRRDPGRVGPRNAGRFFLGACQTSVAPAPAVDSVDSGCAPVRWMRRAALVGA